MRSFIYIFKNIKVTIRKSPWVFGLYLLCNIVAVLVILFSHGVYQNYEVKITQEEKIVDQSYASITFGNVTGTYQDDDGPVSYIADGYSTKGDFAKVLELLDTDTKKGFTGFFVDYFIEDTEQFSEVVSNTEYVSIENRLEYDPQLDKYGLYYTFLENVGTVAGRYFTQEEATTDSGYMVIMYEDGLDNSEKIGEKITVLGREYEIIGVMEVGYTQIYIPFPSIPDDTLIKETHFLSDKTISTDTYRKIKEAFTEVYGDYVNFPEMETIDEDTQTFYASIMMISIVLSALAGITLSILFRYIVYTRRKTLAVMRLNGCTRFKARIMYLAESLGLSSILYVLSAYGYDKFILPQLTRFFPSITEVYSRFTYLYIYAVFIGVLFVIVNIMISFQIDKQPVNMFKKGG